METKTCTHCKEALPISNFTKGAKYKDGYRPQCKACRKEIDRQREENSDAYLDKKVGDDKYRNWLINWRKSYLKRHGLIK